MNRPTAESHANLAVEPLVAIRDLPALLPKRHGKKVHFSTIYRWATKGARGRVLETKRLGGVLYTSKAALDRFLSVETVGSQEREEADALRRVLYGKAG